MKNLFIALAIFIQFIPASYAISEFAYKENFKNEVLPYFNSVEEKYFFGKDNVKLAYRAYEIDHQKGAIVILPGRSEPIHKYAEVIFDLKRLGYSIYIVEHRGQGESGQVDQCNIQYVDQFEDYVTDFAQFMKTVPGPKQHPRLFLLAHSMGATVGALYQAVYHQFQDYPHFERIAFSSPMFDMFTEPYTKDCAIGLSHCMIKLGAGKWVGKVDKRPVSSSQVRTEMSDEMLKQNSSIEWQKVSYQWFSEAAGAILELQRIKLALNPIPILLLQAKNDKHVPPAGQNEFCDALEHCQLFPIPDSYHEILMEADPIRDVAMKLVSRFFLLSME